MSRPFLKKMKIFGGWGWKITPQACMKTLACERMEAAVRRYGIKTEGEAIRPAVDALRVDSVPSPSVLDKKITASCETVIFWCRWRGYFSVRPS